MRGTAASWGRTSVRAPGLWLFAMALALSLFALTSSAAAETGSPDAIASGSLDRPTGGLPHTGDAHNRTKWKVQIGDTIIGTIRGVTDDNLEGETHADVVIKSSVRGNVTVPGIKDGTTITFMWTVPANACLTMVVAYGPVGSNPVGNNSNNDLIRILFNPPGEHCDRRVRGRRRVRECRRL